VSCEVQQVRGNLNVHVRLTGKYYNLFIMTQEGLHFTACKSLIFNIGLYMYIYIYIYIYIYKRVYGSIPPFLYTPS